MSIYFFQRLFPIYRGNDFHLMVLKNFCKGKNITYIIVSQQNRFIFQHLVQNPSFSRPVADLFFCR